MSEETVIDGIDSDSLSVEDNDESLSSTSSSFSDLNNLINSGYVYDIYLNDDYVFDSSTDSDFVNGITLTRSVTIHGNGHTINANNQARIFTVSVYSSFQNIHFMNGYSDMGSAISGSNFVVSDCQFTSNYATKYGGALNGGNVINSIFTDNSANLYAGAIYKGTADSCVFKGNSASEGGAVHSTYSVDSVFIENHAKNYGGALKGVSATRCNFTGNYVESAESYGGAVFDAYVDNCIFINNHATSGGAIGGNQKSASQCIFEENYARDGGASYGYSIVSSTFKNNHATSGGSLYTGSARNCIFEDNYATEKGGALMGATANNCNFINNHAIYGGAMFDKTAEYCNFTSNYADEGGAMYRSHAIKCNFLYNTATTGGAIYESGATSSDFRHNTAVNGGAAAISPDLIYCTFYNNTAENYGGAAYKSISRASYFEFNHAKIGGAISTESRASGSIFKRNVAEITGGAQYDTLIADCDFEDNLPQYVLYVSEVSSIEGIGFEFPVKLYDSPQYPVTGVNATIKITNSKNAVVGTYVCECGDSLFFNLEAGKYKATVTIEDACYEVDPIKVDISIKKYSTVSVVNVVADYGSGKSLIINLKDTSGNPIKYAKVTVVINSASKIYSTDDLGQIIISTKTYVPKTYTVSVKYSGDNTYIGSTGSAKITINKLTPVLTASKATFKLSVKTKQYKVTLKDNKKKAMKSIQLTLKVNGKTYSAKTTSSGVATFKITKLTKKGTFTAQIKYAGSSIYKSVSKSVKITVKK